MARSRTLVWFAKGERILPREEMYAILRRLQTEPEKVALESHNFWIRQNRSARWLRREREAMQERRDRVVRAHTAKDDPSVVAFRRWRRGTT